jgi:hypothetical protein
MRFYLCHHILQRFFLQLICHRDYMMSRGFIPSYPCVAALCRASYSFRPAHTPYCSRRPAAASTARPVCQWVGGLCTGNTYVFSTFSTREHIAALCLAFTDSKCCRMHSFSNICKFSTCRTVSGTPAHACVDGVKHLATHGHLEHYSQYALTVNQLTLFDHLRVQFTFVTNAAMPSTLISRILVGQPLAECAHDDPHVLGNVEGGGHKGHVVELIRQTPHLELPDFIRMSLHLVECVTERALAAAVAAKSTDAKMAMSKLTSRMLPMSR